MRSASVDAARRRSTTSATAPVPATSFSLSSSSSSSSFYSHSYDANRMQSSATTVGGGWGAKRGGLPLHLSSSLSSTSSSSSSSSVPVPVSAAVQASPVPAPAYRNAPHSSSVRSTDTIPTRSAFMSTYGNSVRTSAGATISGSGNCGGHMGCTATGPSTESQSSCSTVSGIIQRVLNHAHGTVPATCQNIAKDNLRTTREVSSRPPHGTEYTAENLHEVRRQQQQHSSSQSVNPYTRYHASAPGLRSTSSIY
jgi:hypothetical protein